MKRVIPASMAVFLCLVISLAGCAPKTDTGGVAKEKLVIISPHWEGIKNEMTAGFKTWYAANGGGAVDIEWLDQGGTSDDMRFIKAGFSRDPEGIDVDLFYGGGVDPYIELAEAGLLEPYELPAELLNSIPGELNGIPLYDDKHLWYGASLAGFGILYNKPMLEQFGIAPPRGWDDLANPDLAGLVGSSDPRHSGSMHMMYEIILQAYGWDAGWEVLIAMGANVRNFPKSSGQVSSDLSVGEVAAGFCIDTYAFSAIEETGEARLGFVLPGKATVITPDPIAILKGAPSRELARAFIRFSLSPEAQRLWMYKKGIPGGPVNDSLNKMSIIPAMYADMAGKTNITTNPFEQPAGFVYDFKKGSARWSLLNDLVGAFIIDTHEDLVSAYKNAKGDEMKRVLLLRPPVSEEEAMRLVSDVWSDPVARNETINEWTSAAKKRYK